METFLLHAQLGPSRSSLRVYQWHPCLGERHARPSTGVPEAASDHLTATSSVYGSAHAEVLPDSKPSENRLAPASHEPRSQPDPNGRLGPLES